MNEISRINSLTRKFGVSLSASVKRRINTLTLHTHTVPSTREGALQFWTELDNSCIKLSRNRFGKGF